jgi:hypothetical protein
MSHRRKRRSFETPRKRAAPQDDDLLSRRHSGARRLARTRNPEQCTMLDSGSAPKRAHPGMTQTFTGSQDDGQMCGSGKEFMSISRAGSKNDALQIGSTRIDIAALA